MNSAAVEYDDYVFLYLNSSFPNILNLMEYFWHFNHLILKFFILYCMSLRASMRMSLRMFVRISALISVGKSKSMSVCIILRMYLRMSESILACIIVRRPLGMSLRMFVRSSVLEYVRVSARMFLPRSMHMSVRLSMSTSLRISNPMNSITSLMLIMIFYVLRLALKRTDQTIARPSAHFFNIVIIQNLKYQKH